MFFRIQSAWLILAALVIALLFFLPVYQGQLSTGTDLKMLITQNYLLMIAAVILVLMPLVAAFQFKNRGTQKSLIWLSISVQFVFLFLIWSEVQEFIDANNFTLHNYSLAAVLPILAVVLLFMAYGAIRKDEKLIKSADRLR